LCFFFFNFLLHQKNISLNIFCVSLSGGTSKKDLSLEFSNTFEVTLTSNQEVVTCVCSFTGSNLPVWIVRAWMSVELGLP